MNSINSFNETRGIIAGMFEVYNSICPQVILERKALL